MKLEKFIKNKKKKEFMQFQMKFNFKFKILYNIQLKMEFLNKLKHYFYILKLIFRLSKKLMLIKKRKFKQANQN